MSELIGISDGLPPFVLSGLGQEESYQIIQTRYPSAFDSSVTRSLTFLSSTPLFSQTSPLTGNAANAGLNARDIGKQVRYYITSTSIHLSHLDPFQNLKQRKDIFSTMYHLPDILAEVRITSLVPLHTRDGNTTSTFGFVVSAKQQIMVCEGTLASFSQLSNSLISVWLVVITVIAIYTKTSRISGLHSNITITSSIGVVSNLAVQVFEHHIGSQFWAIPHSQVLHLKRFEFLSSSAFLCAVTDTPSLTENSLKLSEVDWMSFKDLTSRELKPKIFEGIRSLNKRTVRKEQVADEICVVNVVYMSLCLPRSATGLPRSRRRKIRKKIIFLKFQIRNRPEAVFG